MVRQPVPPLAVQRVLCPHCRESLDPSASVCPHCRCSVLYQLRVRATVTDPRVRYAAARALLPLAPGRALSKLLSALETGTPLLQGLTRETCDTAMQVLDGCGLEGVYEPLPERALSSRSRAWALALAAIAAGSGIALALYQSGRSPDALPAAVPMASAEPARGVPTPSQVASRSLASVVQVRCQKQSGSGFFISERRLLTNEHVTCGADEPLQIETSDGRHGTARVLDASRRLDAALLETADLSGAPLPLVSAGTLATGDTVMVIGSPLGLSSTFHVGHVSNSRRVMLDVCYLQLDARINPGNSGGPVLDAVGRVAGIVSMKRSDGEGIGLALPIDYLYEGEGRLLAPPASHPHEGFVEMVQRADKESARLQEEQAQVGVRLLDARPVLGGRFFAVVMALSESTPRPWLRFRLEAQGGGSCSADAEAEWQLSAPTEGYAARIRDWMGKKGLGEVYAGKVEVDFDDCSISTNGRVELVLRDGDEQTNRVVVH